MELIMGEPFHVDPLKNSGLWGWCSTRRLIFRNERPVGHWTTETPTSKKGYLWLQNYAGFYAPEFYLELDSAEVAIARAKEILNEWDTNETRPTWCC